MPRARGHVPGVEYGKWPCYGGAEYLEVSLEGVAQYLREDLVREWAERTLEVLRTEGPI
jgi:hypothetical protein